MTSFRTPLALFALLVGAPGIAFAKNSWNDLPAAKSAEPLLAAPAPASERTRWLTDDRFGLFIHWGVYSVYAGEYRGKDCETDAHIQNKCRIPNAEYDIVAKAFDPVKFDAKAWVRAAKDAGMKYIVITSKHHDGFAMFKSSNPFNVVDFSAFKRDTLAELAAACREEGLKFCVYYSLGRDWREPDVPAANRENNWDFPGKKNNDIGAYIDRKVKPQVTELLKQYDPAAIWFDTPEHTNAKQSDALMALIRSLRPDCLVNARVGNGRGDYVITEQTVPPGAVTSGKPFEACMTMNRHWGYEKFDANWKSADMMLRVLVDVASKGGNLLLNVGPTGEGEIPAPSLERLHAMGDWLRVNGESVYGSGHTAFGYEYESAAKSDGGVDAMGREIGSGKPAGIRHGVAEPKGWRCTTKPGAIYIHLLDWPKEGPVLKGFQGRLAKATFLADGSPVKYSESGDTVTLRLPEKAPRPGIVVVKLELAK